MKHILKILYIFQETSIVPVLPWTELEVVSGCIEASRIFSCGKSLIEAEPLFVLKSGVSRCGGANLERDFRWRRSSRQKIKQKTERDQNEEIGRSAWSRVKVSDLKGNGNWAKDTLNSEKERKSKKVPGLQYKLYIYM